MDKTESPARAGPQSRFPQILLWLVLAAFLFRLVTVIMHREKKDGGEGLVRWQPVGQAQAAATTAGKPLLYDFTAAWCAPCHRLDAEGWTDSEIASLINRDYVPVRVVDRQQEDGKNPPAIDEVQRKYSINAFPTLVVAAPDGRQIARVQGFGGRGSLLQFLEESKSKKP
jgi:thiol:disulfide interchange protein